MKRLELLRRNGGSDVGRGMEGGVREGGKKESEGVREGEREIRRRNEGKETT